MGRSRLSFLNVLASFFTEVLNPFVLVAALLTLVAWLTDPKWVQTAGVAVLFISAIPLATSLAMVGLGKATDKYIRHRTQRHLFYAISLGSMLIGTALIFIIDASFQARWMLGFAVGTLAIVMVINRWLKISIHALMAALCVVIFTAGLPQGWILALSVAIWAGVSWSRIFLSRHSFIEVLAGSALGSIVGFVFLEVVGGLPSPL
jgi:membrane-associated phospholipid phosphatase